MDIERAADGDEGGRVGRAAVAALMRRSVPGLSIAVVRHDRVLWVEAFGWADVGAALASTTATSYLWFSLSKLVTATAALRLADAGSLDLDAPLAEYVPYLRVAGRQPTMRQLLTHTAGLVNPFPLRWVHPADAPGPDPDLFLRRVISNGRAFGHPVGDRARYSNIGFLAAAQVVAAVAGQPFEEYVRTAVLEPVGMADTGFGYSPSAAAAVGYVRAPRLVDGVVRAILPAGIVGRREGSYLALRRFLVDGAGYGGIVGDIQGAARFLRLHLGNGTIDGTRVLDTATAQDMRTIVARGRHLDHGIGWFRQHTARDSDDYVEHLGAGMGFWNVMRVYPDRDLGIAILANTTRAYDFQALCERLVTAFDRA